MAIALVNEDARGTWTTGTTFVNVQSPTFTNGNMGLILYNCTSTPCTLTSIAQNSGTVAWQEDVEGSTERAMDIYSAPNCQSAGANSTLTMGSVPASDLQIAGLSAEFSGIDTSSHFHSGQFTSGNDTAPTTATLTPPSGRDCLLIAQVRGNTVTNDPGTWTLFTNVATGFRAVYRMVTGDGVTGYNIVWTSVSGQWACAIACYLAPSTAAFPGYDEPWVGPTLWTPPYDPSTVVFG